MVVLDDKKEIQHIISILRQAQRALDNDNSFELQKLSDQTIHSASIQQHTDFITIGVLVYSLSKMIIRKNKLGIKRWRSFVKNINDEINKSITKLQEKDGEEFARHLEHVKELLVDLSPDAKQDVQEVLRKAAVNKASRIYEHGISLSHTAHLLGVTTWELAEYIGQRGMFENPLNITIDIKKRAQMALDFFE